MELIRGEKEEDLLLEQKKILTKTLRRTLKQRKYQVYIRESRAIITLEENLIKGSIDPFADTAAILN